jgi:hypothetical protein
MEKVIEFYNNQFVDDYIVYKGILDSLNSYLKLSNKDEFTYDEFCSKFLDKIQSLVKEIGVDNLSTLVIRDVLIFMLTDKGIEIKELVL